MQRDSAELDNWSSKKEGYEKEIQSLTSRQEELEALVQIDELTKVRAELKEGEPCPVCGSLEHPFAANLPPEVATAKERLAVVKEESTDLQKIRKKLIGKLTFLKIGSLFLKTSERTSEEFGFGRRRADAEMRQSWSDT